jgi:hypothetical protein
MIQRVGGGCADWTGHVIVCGLAGSNSIMSN